MPKLSRLLPFIALLALIIAGCGGAVSHGKTGKTLTLAGHPCSASDATMGCELPPASAGLAPRSTPSTYGIDFAWSGVSAARAKAIGARFGASYLSTDLSKNWSLAAVNAYHAAGLATVAVWETAATRATQGYAAGVWDAQQAKAQAAALGDTTAGIDFAVDCPCAPSSVLGYFQGVHHVLGDRGNAYGDYAVISYLHAHGVVGNENWATYAWSGGLWPPASIAPLEQYLNGSAFDNDRALAANYGQWPQPAKPARVLPRCFHHRLTPAKCRAVKAKVASDHRAAQASARVLAGLLPIERTMRHRIRWFTNAASKLQGAN